MYQMEEYLDILFKKISPKINKSEEKVQSIIQKLRKNGYDTQDTLNKVSSEDLQKINIPLRVISLIKAQLSEQTEQTSLSNDIHKKRAFQQKFSLKKVQMRKKEEQQVKILQKQLFTEENIFKNEDQSMKIIKKNKRKFRKDPLRQVYLDEQEIYDLCQNFKNNLMMLHKKDKLKAKQIFQGILRMIQGILDNPNDMKFRTINKENKLVAENFLCIEFLKEIGFQQVENSLQLIEIQVHYLYFIEDCLRKILKSKKLKLTLKSYNNALYNLRSFMKIALSTPLLERNLSIYHKSIKKYDLPHQVIRFDYFFPGSMDEVVQKCWKAYVSERNEGLDLNPEKRAMFEELISKPIFLNTTIKIEVKDQIIIEAWFNSGEKLSEVYANLTAIIETYGSLSLYVGVDKIKCEHYEFQKSLLDLGAVPYGYFYLECDQPYEIGRLYEDLIEYP